jgi:hypothetical protein
MDVYEIVLDEIFSARRMGPGLGRGLISSKKKTGLSVILEKERYVTVVIFRARQSRTFGKV